MKQNNNYLAVSAIWYERFLECSRTHGTNQFPSSVQRFYVSLLDLDKEDLAIKTKVKNYKENTWQERVNYIVQKNTELTTDPGTIESERELVEAGMSDELFEFIIQTIQDSGIGWPTQEDMKQYTISQG